MKNYTIQQLRDENLIIFECITGSRAYGTSTPESDTDVRGVFIAPINYILKYGFPKQVADETNDVIFYELGRFMDLLQKNNPNILELLEIPEDCVIKTTQEFQFIQMYKKEFLTKKVRWTFAGYAIEQIKKARGYNKKMNWEEAEMKCKTVLDFCYILEDGGSISLEAWLKNSFVVKFACIGMSLQKDFGLVSIDHAHDMYAMYMCPEEDLSWGIVSDKETANDIHLTSVPKGLIPIAYLTFNKDGYSSHCKKYAEYQTCLKERNPNRVKMNKKHGKNYDSKNMLHTYRLLTMALEMAEGKLIVRRPPEEIEKLMKIRRGEYEYEDLLKEAEDMILRLDETFDGCSLPDDVNTEFSRDLLFKIRKYYYKL
jgi:uncharacterized protein